MILKTTQDEITNNRQRYKKNLKKQEITALRNLQQNHRIVIKPADKGGTIVIQDKEKCIAECERQLNNPQHYRILPTDPTKEFFKQISQIINEAYNMNIIDEKTKDSLLIKHPRIASFYILPKIHKEGNPGRPIVNGIGTITKKLSAYIDQHIRPLVPNIPTYILVRANLKYDPTPRICQPCYKTHCRTCQHINTNIAVTNKQNISYPIRGNFNCQSYDIIYIMTCEICEIQYVGESQIHLTPGVEAMSAIRNEKDHPVA